MESDRDLVERSLRGELAAFSTLVDRYRYAVFGLCLGHIKDVDTAEDIAQEAFIKAFLELRNLRDQDRFAPWLRRIAANACHTWHRRQMGHTSLSELGMKELVAPTNSPQDELVSREIRQTVLAALGQLSALQQQVITLFYLEELSLEQIAAFLDISPHTVKQRLYRARLRLKEVMLGLVEQTFREQKLPDDFTDQVISAALTQGRQLLEQRRWPEAKAEFRRIVFVAAQHREARRGMAQALAGEIKEMLDAEQPYDEKVVQEAFAALEEGFRLGARDQESVWGLVRLYQSTSRYEDLVRLMEIYMVETEDSEQAIQAFACASYNTFAFFDDFKRIFELHRRFLATEHLELRHRLGSYCRPVLWAYLEMGQAEVWLAETEVLIHKLGSSLTRSHCTYYCGKIDLLNRTGKYRAALQTGRHFLDLLEKEEVEDPIERRRWRIDIGGSMLQSCQGMGNEDDLRELVEVGWGILREYEAEWKTALDAEAEESRREKVDHQYRRYVGGAFHIFGYYCKQAGLIKEAIGQCHEVKR